MKDLVADIVDLARDYTIDLRTDLAIDPGTDHAIDLQ